MISGKWFVRATGNSHGGKNQFMMVGQLWVPARVALKSEHIYRLVGSQVEMDLVVSTGPHVEPVLSLQTLVNSAEDVTEKAKRLSPTKLMSLVFTDKP